MAGVDGGVDGSLMRSGLHFAGASGLLLAASMPGIGWGGVAWVALVPLFLAIDGRRAAAATGLGWFAGIVFSLGSVGWLVSPLRLTAGMALHEAVAVLGALAVVAGSTIGLFAGATVLVERWKAGPSLVAAGSLWALAELARDRFLPGIPWNPLAATQLDRPDLMQAASIFGGAIVAAIVVAANRALAHALAPGRSTTSTFWGGVLALEVAIGLAVYRGDGSVREIERPAPRGPRVLVVQTDIPALGRDAPEIGAALLEVHRDATAAAFDPGVDLIVWPESATSLLVDPRSDGDESLPLRAFVDLLRTPLLAGVRGERSVPLGRGAVARATNRIAYVPPGTADVEVRDKRWLVPGGERRIWPSVSSIGELAGWDGPIAPGDDVEAIDTIVGRLGVVVCSEIGERRALSRLAAQGVDFFVHPSNDRWLGETAGPRQHEALARLRAIEWGRSVVRATNGGISGFIDPSGRVRGRLPPGASGTVTERVRVLR